MFPDPTSSDSAMLVLLIVLSAIIAFPSDVTACNFGVQCTFPCNCGNGVRCDRTSGCMGDCETGWTGPGCLTQANIALHKQADQSSVAQGDAGIAVDGNKGVRDPSDCTYLYDKLSWWRVRFDGLYRLSSLHLYVNPLQENGKIIEVYATNHTNPSDISLHQAVLCAKARLNVESSGVQVMPFSPDCVGEALILARNRPSLSPDINLSICEVVVEGHVYIECENCGTSPTEVDSCSAEYGCVENCPIGRSQESFCKEGCRNGRFGRNCVSHCSGHCKDNAPCSNVDGTCANGCQDWYISRECRTYLYPAALQNQTLHIEVVSSSSMRVRWSPESYTDPDVRPHYGYRVQYTSSCESGQITTNNTNLSETSKSSAVITGLDHNTVYRVIVFPYRFDGDVTDEGVPSVTDEMNTSFSQDVQQIQGCVISWSITGVAFTVIVGLVISNILLYKRQMNKVSGNNGRSLEVTGHQAPETVGHQSIHEMTPVPDADAAQYEEMPYDTTETQCNRRTEYGRREQYEGLQGEERAVYENREVTGPYASIGE